ncbi:MAG TPA: carboxymuconolactone decarboxylase family protein [Amycolatopsis sp.]|nr:carboxymuconolactone decarboxylase family protein [Amycolatopsis sp.]
MTHPTDVGKAAENAGNAVLRPTDQSIVDWADRARIALRAAAAAGYPPYVQRLAIHLDLLADGAAAIVLDRRRWPELLPSVQALLACASDPEETRLGQERLAVAAQVAGYAGCQARLLLGWELAGRSAYSGEPERFAAEGLPTIDEALPERVWVPPPVVPPAELRDAVAALLPEADRELVALAVSLAMGDESGISGHGRRHARMSGDAGTAVALAAKGPDAVPGPRERAIAQAATQLARTPAALTEADLSRLTSQDARGVVAAAALATWEARLAITLARA